MFCVEALREILLVLIKKGDVLGRLRAAVLTAHATASFVFHNL